MKSNLRVFAGAAALAVSAASMASDYSFEAGGSWFDFDGESAWGADFTFYFDPVRPDNGPLDQAGFLNRASNLSIDYVRDTSGNFDAIGGQLELYLEGFYFGAGASRFSNGFDIDTYSLRAGWMIGPTTRVTGGWDRIDLPFGSDIDIFTVGAKHVALLTGDSAFHIDAEVGAATNGSTELAYAVAADYYPMREFGFGLRFAGIDSDNQYGLGARYFFTPRLSGSVEWMRDDLFDDDTFQLRLAARF